MLYVVIIALSHFMIFSVCQIQWHTFGCMYLCIQNLVHYHRRNNHRDRGRLVPNFLGGGPTMYWCRQYKHSSHQNAGFSIWVFKNFPGHDTPGPSQQKGATPSRTQHPARPAFGQVCSASAPVLGPKPWSPLTFQSWLCPCSLYSTVLYCITGYVNNINININYYVIFTKSVIYSVRQIDHKPTGNRPGWGLARGPA